MLYLGSFSVRYSSTDHERDQPCVVVVVVCSEELLIFFDWIYFLYFELFSTFYFFVTSRLISPTLDTIVLSIDGKPQTIQPTAPTAIATFVI